MSQILNQHSFAIPLIVTCCVCGEAEGGATAPVTITTDGTLKVDMGRVVKAREKADVGGEMATNAVTWYVRCKSCQHAKDAAC